MKREKHYTEEELIELEELKKEREELKNKIAEVQAKINRIIRNESVREHYRKTYVKHPQNSKVIELFGKRFKDLTEEEKKGILENNTERISKK